MDELIPLDIYAISQRPDDHRQRLHTLLHSLDLFLFLDWSWEFSPAKYRKLLLDFIEP